MYPADYRTGDEDDCPCVNGQSAPSASCPYHPCDPTVGIADVQNEPHIFADHLDDWSKVMDLPPDPPSKVTKSKESN